MYPLWNFLLKKRQFSWFLMAVLIAAGAYSVFMIPKESAPEVIIPIGIVSTSYPGASAVDIEELITNKLEIAIEGVENLDTITSTSQDGFSMITAQFDADANIDESIQKLKDAVDAAQSELPEDANDPFVSEINFQNQPIVILAVSADLPPREFTELGEMLEEELSSVAGVSNVDVTGVRAREVQVLVRSEALALYDLSLADVQNAIRGANLSVPIGTVLMDDVAYAIRFEADVQDANEIANIPVTERNGAIVYLRDVAEVRDNVEQQTSLSRVSIDGDPSETAMTLSLYKRAGFDVTAMSASVDAKLAELQQPGNVLADSAVLVVFDQGEWVKKDLSGLIHVGFETVFLVSLCLLLTIGWRESLVAALSIPLSFVIAFIGLYISGNTINFISLFALILAVGILVDSGIVVTEAIHTRMRTFKDKEEAARASIREYAWPLIGGTMTTIAVFVPLFFLSGIVGEFISSIPFTIIFVLLASIVVALGMVPLIAITLTRPVSTNRFEELQEQYTVHAQQWYRAKLVRFFENTRAQRIFLWSLAGGFVLAILLPVFGLLSVIFFPPEDVDYLYIDLETAEGTPLYETDLALRAVEEVLYQKEYIASFTTTTGTGSAFTGGGAGAKFGSVTVNLEPERELTSAEIARDLRESLAPIETADITIQEQVNGPPTGAPVLIQFIGEDLDALATTANNAAAVLRDIPGTTNVTPSTKSNATEIVLSIDRAKAAAAGVSPATAGAVLRGAVFGLSATTLTINGDDIDVVVKLAIDENAADPSAIPELTLDELRNISIPTQSGTVYLGSIVSSELRATDTQIAHTDRSRVESVSADVEPGTTALQVVTAFQAREAELNLPSGVTVKYGGETEDINETFREMFVALIGGLLLMLAILVLAFNSIRYSLYLLLAVPLSLIGVFGGLALTGQALSFTSLLGVIALAGVIINHAIILMDSMIHYRAASHDTPLIDTVADAAVSRFRPIFLTTITTVVGMIPLSTISDFWSPLAFAIMFGLTFAMILTLILVPTLFYRNEKRKMEKAALNSSREV